jgi:hypothetical protein
MSNLSVEHIFYIRRTINPEAPDEIVLTEIQTHSALIHEYIKAGCLVYRRSEEEVVISAGVLQQYLNKTIGGIVPEGYFH